MAVNEPGAGGGVTELLSGWSFVVHRPSEDPEPSSLPSTVDIAAFSAGPSEHQTPHSPCSRPSDSDSDSDTDNSGSEASGSYSASSSDSESTSSSQGSSHRSSPPAFNLTSMPTGGLKLKIAAVPKSAERDDDEGSPSSVKPVSGPVTVTSASGHSSDSNSDCSDTDSDTESQSTTTKSDVSDVKITRKTRISNKSNKNTSVDVKVKSDVKHKPERASRPIRGRGRHGHRNTKMSSSSHVSTKGSTSGSDEPPGESESEANSAMLASCSLQEIRQEDLAAILPDQQECDAFGGFECETRVDKTLNNETDGSGSDMELPPQLVNAAIQCATEVASDTETCTPQPLLYANSLLQQFEAQTQMLSTTPSQNPVITSPIVPSTTSPLISTASTAAPEETVKRKRGRPRKRVPVATEKIIKSVDIVDTSRSISISVNNNIPLPPEYSGEPNVSPDSGIQDSPEHVSSPEPTPTPHKTKDKIENKLIPSAANTNRGKQSSSDSGKNKKNIEDKSVKSKTIITQPSETVKVKNTKQDKPKLPLGRHNLDRILYANTDRVLYPPRRKVGRPPIKVGVRRPGRPPKHKHSTPPAAKVESVTPESENVQPNTQIANKATAKETKINKKSTVVVEKKPVKSAVQKPIDIKITKESKKHKSKFTDKDLLQLNSLSLGKSIESQRKNGELKEMNANLPNRKSKILNEICDKVSRRLELPATTIQTEGHTHYRNTSQIPPSKSAATQKITKNNKKTLVEKKATFATHKHKHHKHHRVHRRVHRTEKVPTLDPKLLGEIEKLIADFMKYCIIDATKATSNKIPEIFKCVKRVSKKRKCSDNIDGRKKKKQCSTVVSGESKEPTCNEQRLPLKKRHYHVSNGEHRAANVSTSSVDSLKTADLSDVDAAAKHVSSLTQPGLVKNTAITQKVCVEKPKPILQKDSSKSITMTTEIECEVKFDKVSEDIPSPASGAKTKTKELFRTHIQEAIEACINRYTSPLTSDQQKNLVKLNNQTTIPNRQANTTLPETVHTIKSMTATTPKKRHKLENDSLHNAEKANIDKAVKNITDVNNVEKNEKHLNEITVGEDKNKNVVDSVVDCKSLPNQCDEHKNKKALSKLLETVAQIKTRKKNRLEDLTSNLVSKITPATEALDSLFINNQRKTTKKNTEEESPVAIPNRATVIKSPPVRKTKLTNTDKPSDLDGNIVSDNPTGIFLPTIDIELHIPASTIRTTSGSGEVVKNDEPSPKSTETHNLRQKKNTDQVKSDVKVVAKVETETKKKKEHKKLLSEKDSKSKKESNTIVEKNDKVKNSNVSTLVEKVKNQSAVLKSEKSKADTGGFKDVLKKRPRRRKAINRTGFPTVKKKKKKSMSIITSIEINPDVSDDNVYDRIPRIDEMASTFVERTEKSLSVVALERLQTKTTMIASKPINQHNLLSKSEIKHERETASPVTIVPETNSMKNVKVERPFSRLELKQERASLLRDLSPASSLELRPKRQLRDLSADSHGKQSPAPSSTTDEVDLKSVQRSKRRLRDHSSDSKSLDNLDSIKRKRERSFDPLPENVCNKRRLRDISPASSNEPLPSDKRIRSDDAASASGDEIRRSRKPPRWRKRYLVAGLFSDFFKEDEPRRSEPLSNKTKFVYKREDHPHGLLPPPYHCGKYLRSRRTHFQLPHDLWWQHTHSRLPGRDIVPSWNYRKIRTNVYCARPGTGACEPQACNCSEAAGCGDDCINRLVLAECPASHRCKNQRIQKHDWAPGIDKFMTEDKGWGVRTKLPIKNGEFILEYVGEVVSDQEFKQRMALRYAHDTHHYCLHLDGGLVIDGHRMGGDGRFVNHSCQPNCEMQKWSVNGQFRMALFALRDIKADEELTYDYNFSLFNPADGQVCKCKSENCRGVIGGKSQRVKPAPNVPTNGLVQETTSVTGSGPGRVGRPRKNQARRTTSGSKDSASEKSLPIMPPTAGAAVILPQIRPLTNQQKTFVSDHHCFLLKNLNKVKKIRNRSASLVSQTTSHDNANIGSAFLNHLNALRQPRNMRTRRLAQAEGDPELTKTARLAAIFRDLWSLVANAKDEKNDFLSAPFMVLPSKRKVPEYYSRVVDPIDLTTIEQNIESGGYRTVESFDADMSRLLDNSVKYFGRTSELGIAATRIRKIYGEAKLETLLKLKDILGEKPPAGFVTTQNPGGEEEDVIRCICGLYRDEGLMIQCERCLVWQHCECVKADVDAPSYHCERCQPRAVDYEIPLDEFTEHGHRYYLSLMRGELQLRQGDTVYVLRDISIEGTDRKHTYETIGHIDYSELDIFRIERLWRDKTTGKRMAYGHHYLRPHETYHEPTRKFFANEVMRVPLYEAVPVELIMSRCWVLDINTFCKGRPIGAPEEHIYICEYRVDKSARLFSKVSSKSHYPLCTKNYAFERFETRLKISRTYAPHELGDVQVKPRGRRPHDSDTKLDLRPITLHVPIIRTREEQKTRLNAIILKLLNRLPTKQPLDVSYLLEAGRRRKKVQS